MNKYKGMVVFIIVCFAGAFLAGKLLAQEKSPSASKVSPVAQEGYPDMVLVPAGEFIMGDDTRYNWTFMLAYNIYDGPEHAVYLDAYYIDKHEVTNEQYKKFVEETGYRKPSCWNDARFNQPQYPVVGVSWEDAVAYANWIGKRLPTEAEWEKAARGIDKRLWPWGNKFDKELCNVWESAIKATTPVGKYAEGKSPYGCFDMAGNVWEWCADYYDQNYYYVSPSVKPSGPDSGMQRVIRGGGFLYFSHYARCAARYRVPPYTQSPQIGFRCVKTAGK